MFFRIGINVFVKNKTKNDSVTQVLKKSIILLIAKT